MTRPHSLSTRSLAALAVSLVLLTGCTADLKPSPSPTPTPLFASKKDAFAAAEATYRAYNDALNLVDFADPHTFEAVFALLSADASASTRKAFSEFHAEQVRSVGETTFDSFAGTSADLFRGKVDANVCVDVSGVDVLDESGASIVSPERPARQPMRVRFLARSGEPRMTITDIYPSDEFTCAR